MSSKLAEIRKLRSAGLSYADIGDRFGISRQRAWSILNGNGKGKKRADSPRQVLRVGEAAAMLGVHINTVRRWTSCGILNSYRYGPRGDRRFPREEIEALLENGTF